MARRIDTQARNEAVRFEEQAGDPAQPAAGYRIVYAKAGGIYEEDDTGAVVGPFGTGGGDVATDDIWDAKGDLAVGTGANTAEKLTVGANGLVPVADSSLSGGIGWKYLPGKNTILDDDPLTIRGCIGWYDAGKMTGLNDGDTVTSWDDASGYGVDMIAVGTRPTYQTNEINSLPIVRFGGAGWFVFPFPGLYLQTHSWAMVFKMNDLTQAYNGIIGYNPFGDGGGFMIKSTGKTALYEGGSNRWDGTGAATINTADYQYYIFNAKYATVDSRKNGVADTTGATHAMINYTTHLAMLGNQYVASRNASMDVAEFIVYKNELTSANITTLESYLSTKYSL